MPLITETRTAITPEQIESAIISLRNKITYRLKQKGNGSLVSRHEIFGLISEEVHELEHALIENGPEHADFIAELLDVAVGCIFGIACIRAGTLDW